MRIARFRVCTAIFETRCRQFVDSTALARLPALSIADWKYDPSVSRRDLRLDLLRGLFLTFMIIYHLHQAWMIQFTYEFLGTVSSAEGFVFLSGMVVGLVYLPILRNQGLVTMTRRVWRRAFHLYAADVVTLGGLLLFSAFVFPLKPVAKIIESSSPLNLLVETVTLHVGTFGFDILLLYILLLLITPLVLWLINTGRVRWVLVASATCYVLYRISPDTFSWQFANKDNWRFSPMLWQVIYVGGILTVTYRDWLKALWHRLAKYHPAFLVTLLFFAFFVWRQMLDLQIMRLDPHTYDFWFDKSTLGPGRLVNFVVLAIVIYWFVNQFWRPLAAGPGKILIPLGQASLYVFIVHLIIAYLYRSVPIALPLEKSGIYDLATVLFIWFLVRRRFLFQYVPH